MMLQETSLHKKRFGQYFSGKMVADMLFSLLPEGREWTSVVDPMAGIGDMLVSVRENSKNYPLMLGIEIDEAIAKKCAERVPEAKICSCDAFKSDDIAMSEGFDLVITNPPYVRYQLQNTDDVMPSAQEIRENLICQIGKNQHLSEDERALFLQLAKNYSGLSDMAVPAWILCAALVKKEGYLAMVVPETWLNRDYAAPIQYLLLKCFEVKTVAIDTNANWFTDALVKTCLVVAKRIEMQPLLKAEKYNTQVIETDRSYVQPTVKLFPYLKGSKEARKWALSEDRLFFASRPELPHELVDIIGTPSLPELVFLSDMAIECGQGLRTGANEFFYVGLVMNEGETCLVHSKAWDQGGKDYRFQESDIIPVLQNRTEIDGLVVSQEKLKTAVIYPHGKISGALQDYISSAENYRDTKGRLFKDYSAVSPNEKKENNIIVREWFRLPRMANRHLPNLCLTRVSAKIPECLFVNQDEKKPIVIDANMVTLWGCSARMIKAVFAMLNSTWCKLSLELICTVMGGGALKVEASHLKRLQLPKLCDNQIDELESVGKELIAEELMTESIQDKIDSVIGTAFRDKEVTSRLRDLLKRKYSERSVR